MKQDEINAVKKAAEKMRKQESAQDEIIEMWNGVIKYAPSEVRITEFAKLVADKAFQNGYEKGIAGFNEAVSLEREACAKLCEEPWQGSPKGIAEQIRARGEA